MFLITSLIIKHREMKNINFDSECDEKVAPLRPLPGLNLNSQAVAPNVSDDGPC